MTPNLFLIGAPKAGTSSLADQLAGHPDIFCEVKEPRFFDAHVFHDNPAHYRFASIDEYLELYTSVPAQNARYRLDASVFVMYDLASVKQILDVSPEAKFIVVLRDPLSASLSMHGQRMKYVDPKLREVSDSFCDCWDLLPDRAKGDGFPAGCENTFVFRYDALYQYDLYVPSIIDLVGSEHILVLSYDDLKARPKHLTREVAEFLSIDIDAFELIRKKNAGYRLKNSMRNQLVSRTISVIARRSASARRWLGINKNQSARVANALRGLTSKETGEALKLPQECENRVKADFAATYAFMNELFPEHAG
jgi:hypothetical protein